MEDHQKFLKVALFSERSIMSYRLLSRKLKVHVNKAKEMLYDFYTNENSRKSNCIHATYVITGFRKPLPSIKGQDGSDDEGKDTEMQCSPFDSSFPGTQTTVTAEDEKKKMGELMKVIELCQEEDLDAAKAEFEKILSIHIYSLEPVPLKNLSTLTGCSADVLEISQNEDMLKMGATYGTILNPSARRTSGRGPPPALVSQPKKSTLAVQEKKKEVIPSKELKLEKKDTRVKEEAKADEKETKPIVKASTIPAKKVAPSAVTKSKRAQSNLFTSWGNAPKKSAETVSESNSTARSPKIEEEPDVKMESGDDEEEESEGEPSKPAPNSAEEAKKRKARDDELRRMMDEEEDDEAKVAISSGRRRGKRKIMKKVQARDDEGYIVTKTEAVWESFSEDEPEPPPKPKPKVAVKGKKGPVAGQGNIMSFFAKK